MNAYMPKAKTVEWETPQELFDKLNQEFHFTLDVCATIENAKCLNYFTKEQNGLIKGWRGNCFMNPPYGLAIRDWVSKAYMEAKKGTTVVCLLPVRSDTQWFHQYIWDAEKHRCRDGVEMRLLKGRLKFGNNGESATFPSMIVIFRG